MMPQTELLYRDKLVDYFILGLMWVAFIIVHSLLATASCKQWLGKQFSISRRNYRISYNAISISMLLLPLWWSISLPHQTLWAWSGILGVIVDVITILAVLLFIWTLRYYPLGEFFGLTVVPKNSSKLVFSPIHRYVRHPWYFTGLVFLWTRDMTDVFLVTACLVTFYFIIGSRREDSKLTIKFGDRYRQYRSQVGGIFPVPWRYLTREQWQSLNATR